MKVYRIQSKQDRTQGPYDVDCRYANRPTVVKNLHAAHGWCCEDHPSVWGDIGRSSEENEYCGCETAAGLLRWFKGFIPNLLHAGYEIVCLEDVTITAIGEYQVLFRFNEDKCYKCDRECPTSVERSRKK